MDELEEFVNAIRDSQIIAGRAQLISCALALTQLSYQQNKTPKEVVKRYVKVLYELTRAVGDKNDT